MDARDLRSKTEVVAPLRRTGVSEETIEALDALLEDQWTCDATPTCSSVTGSRVTAWLTAWGQSVAVQGESDGSSGADRLNTAPATAGEALIRASSARSRTATCDSVSSPTRSTSPMM
jgi:hypothetical protein